jgi:hypothetical protein
MISKRTIRGWLENYQGLIEEDRRVDDIPRNSGRKPDDGITDGMLNRVMLMQGLSSMRLEADLLYNCCKARWIDKDSFNFTLRRLGLSKDEYYRRCDWAIDYLYYKINGYDSDRKRLLSRLVRLDAL